MISRLCVFMAVLCACPAYPQQPPSSAAEETCGRVYEIAEATMMARQAGASIRELIEHPEANELTKYLARKAFETPLYSTERIKQEETTEFANQEYIICFDQLTQ